MKYDEALKHWGASKISTNDPDNPIDIDSVIVTMHFDEGYQSDCSCGTSPSADVIISGRDSRSKPYIAYIDIEEFNFIEVLKELVDISGGNITGENND